VVICLEQDADLHMALLMPLPLTISCSSNIQIGFTFLVPAHLGSPGKGLLNVCACARARVHVHVHMCECVCACACTCTCTCVRAHARARVRARARARACVRACVRVYRYHVTLVLTFCIVILLQYILLNTDSVLLCFGAGIAEPVCTLKIRLQGVPKKSQSTLKHYSIYSLWSRSIPRLQREVKFLQKI